MSGPTIRCRVLSHEVGDGPANMALDEALLDSVAADPSTAIVRTYEWSTPTLSLGYFQSIAEVEADERWHGVPVVRRSTGGGALWHDREITYLVVIPARHPATRPSSGLYARIHRAIVEKLRLMGVEADRRGSAVDSGESSDRPFLCFTDRDTEDIVLRQAKIVGSAQRRRAGAVLQHGSLLLRTSPTTPELPGLLDLVPALSDSPQWPRLLSEILPGALDLDSTHDQISPEERERAARLSRELYGNPAWTRRR